MRLRPLHRPCQIRVYGDAEVAVQADGPTEVGAGPLAPLAIGAGQLQSGRIEHISGHPGPHLSGPEDQHPNQVPHGAKSTKDFEVCHREVGAVLRSRGTQPAFNDSVPQLPA